MFQVLVLHVEDASCCWVRLLEHRTSRVGQATPHVRDYTAEFLELAMNLSKWFAQPSNCVRYQLVKVGDLCAIKEGSSFHRCRCVLILYFQVQKYILPTFLKRNV